MIMICNGFLSFARDNQLSDQYIYHDEVIKQFFFSFMFGCFLWYQSPLLNDETWGFKNHFLGGATH
jgi:hypothetical protein